MAENDNKTQSQRFCEMWAESMASSLGSYGVNAATASASDPVSAAAPTQEEFEKLVCVRFSGAKALKGELLWVVEKPAALQIARLLTGAAPDATEMSDEDRDAFAEFLRQVAGQTATSWKAELGSEIDLVYQATAEHAPVTAQCVTLKLAGENFSEIPLRLFLDADLGTSLASIPAAPPPQAAVAEPAASSAADNGVPPGVRTEPLPANLGLVLDVALQATIRFGEKQMLLRDIFGLMAGAVVELNQMVNEPAELHVAGRLVARGEVVVVDGNFGLRVTEVASINERVAAIDLS
jgi:flagellar motor switch protein FliN